VSEQRNNKTVLASARSCCTIRSAPQRCAPAVTHILFERTEFSPRRIYTDGRDWPQTNHRQGGLLPEQRRHDHADEEGLAAA
jgi:hypothetical protein